MRTRVKICGLKTPGDVRSAVDAGADAVGFVFEPSSPRFVEPAHAAKLARLARLVPPFVWRVGVFLDAVADRLEDLSAAVGLQAVQVHGRLDRKPEGVMLIRAVSFDSVEAVEAVADDCDLILFDNPRPGSGEEWDWKLAASVARERRIILAGGLGPANVREAVREVRPYGVDVSSGVERARGVKDAELMRSFIAQVRRADLEGGA